MGTWARSNGAWRLSGTAVRTVLIAPTSWPGSGAIVLDIAFPTNLVKAVFFSSTDGRTCLRLGIDDATYISLQSVEYGAAAVDIANTVVTPADVPPGAVACRAAHGLTAGVPFRLEVRYVDQTIFAYLNGSTTAVLRHKLTAGELTTWGRNRSWGFESDQVGLTPARVLRAQLCQLVQQVTNRAEVLVAVAGGDLWAAIDDGQTDELQINLVATGVFAATGQVALAAFEQKAYGFDGTHAKVFDTATLAVSDFGAASGSGVIPGAFSDGAGAYVAGTSRMTLVETILARLSVAGDPQDPQNVFESASGNVNDWDTAAIDSPGRAIALGDPIYGKIGDPVTCIKQMSKGILFIGTKRAMGRLVGDPAGGVATYSPSMIAGGVSGKDAAAPAPFGSLVVHSPDGLYLVPPGGDPVPLSAGVLGEGIEFAREAAPDYYVQVLEDSSRHLMWVFLTPVTSGAATHFAYDETVGGFQPGRGGFMPQQFPDRIGPTASCLWRGRPVLGTRDGYIVEFDESATATDDGTAIASKFPMTLLKEPDLNRDTILHQMVILPGKDSAAITYKVFGGPTPEKAYGEATRTLLVSGTVPTDGRKIVRKVRDPALVLELSAASGRMLLEAVEVETEPGMMLSRRTRQARPTPDATISDTAVPTADPEPTAGVVLLDVLFESIVEEPNRDQYYPPTDEFIPVPYAPPPDPTYPNSAEYGVGFE